MDLPTMLDADTQELTASWSGTVTPYVVGDPGRAATAVVERLARDAPDHHGTVLDGAVVRPDDEAPWTHVRGASVRGLRHRQDGVVRQDEYCFRQTADDRYLVVAVADGVSAGSLSHEAAGVAARFGCEIVGDWLGQCEVSELPWEHVLKTLSDLVVQRGRAVLRRRRVSVDDWSEGAFGEALATTLVLAVVDLRPDDGSYRVEVVRVGDSSAWVHGAAGGWRSLHGLKNDSEVIASSATAALPQVTSFESESYRVAAGDLLVLMTDGVSDPLGDGDGDFGRFLSEVWATPPSVTAFGAQVDFARKTFDDDRTAVAVWLG
ncbi:protein phosphatase 2C domain-containing protein [Actinomycetospora endophytica]|uniref:Protein phosphatase 2C domain-containing protein n=1 Tax=Actinomycetospora endophytica TaxID=2291215 RepID=A0ABS8PCZ6_9PSEU|nr:protein phosphatase 2C domain-containing protein [Actinomycetospora endophytica]MCD2196142.1 protein phosphatase 2C domain-containing protein [Actinomycetospora endophytica]